MLLPVHKACRVAAKIITFAAMNRIFAFVGILVLLLGFIAYTTYRIWHILPLPHWGKTAVAALYLLCFLVVFPHYMMGDKMPFPLAAATYEIGNSWLIFFLYALIIFLALDLGRLVHLVPKDFVINSLPGTCAVFGITIGLLTYGGFHYHHKYREVIEIETEKQLEKPLTIVLASDLHAGYHNREKELGRWVNLINAEHPDLVLFAGDIVDGSLRPVIEKDYASIFRRIEAPVYACLGNHEYIGGKDQAEEFIGRAGITLLKDRAAEACGIRIIGRDDLSNPCRAALWELFKADGLFTIVLDHQPYNLEAAEEAGADFQFSGHTHHGQVWPGNWLTDAMYEKAFGAYQRGNTRYYITSGLGIWGGKFRIGTRSEYIVLKLTPKVVPPGT